MGSSPVGLTLMGLGFVGAATRGDALVVAAGRDIVQDGAIDIAGVVLVFLSLFLLEIRLRKGPT